MLLLGGIQTVMGPLVGAAVLHTLKDQVMPLTELWRSILGLSIIVMVLLFPEARRRVRAVRERSGAPAPRRRPHDASGVQGCAKRSAAWRRRAM